VNKQTNKTMKINDIKTMKRLNEHHKIKIFIYLNIYFLLLWIKLSETNKLID